MTPRLWQIRPKLNYSKDIVDIVQFGSSVKEGSTPNDIDIAVIFNKIAVKEQLNQSQFIKKQITRLSDKPIHIISFDYYSLMDISNFAGENILSTGFSILSGEYFVNRFGMIPKANIYYSLRGISKKDKVRFNYMLNGRKGEYGLIRKYGGKIIRPGLVEVQPEYREIFLHLISAFTRDYELRLVLEFTSGKKKDSNQD